MLNYKMQTTISGISVSGTGKAWVGVSDGLPHQVDLNGTLSGVAVTSHIVYDEYGHPFDIQVPK